ncbi:MAG: phosphate acyltransferase PlsX [Oscillospiraceae bacterium]|nr:phosphate acyltransferase PlsX [Oscillospiraceae bacterium]
MKIVVDAMGGDNAPMEIVKGAVKAVEELDTDVILVGIGEEILRCIQSLGMSNLPKGIEIAHTSQVITMEDEPTSILREKRESSMAVGLDLIKDGTGDALVSAGSTGALLSGATLILKRIRGIRRAALAPLFPTEDGKGCIVIDCGANVENTVEYLTQFAFMGAAYAKSVFGRANPRVGLLNIGSEPTKGDTLHKEAYAALTELGNNKEIDFIGNVEARDILMGAADVIVTDGWSGNVMLKSFEGAGVFMGNAVKSMFLKNFKTKLAAALVKKEIYEMRAKLDYSETGGSILLGVAKPVVKAHGSSNANAVKNAIGQAKRAVEGGLIGEITSYLANVK